MNLAGLPHNRIHSCGSIIFFFCDTMYVAFVIT